jgi:hypothetical protein
MRLHQQLHPIAGNRARLNRDAIDCAAGKQVKPLVGSRVGWGKMLQLKSSGSHRHDLQPRTTMRGATRDKAGA